MHLQDWVGQHPYLFWLLLAPLFAAAEALLAGRRIREHQRQSTSSRRSRARRPGPVEGAAPGRWLLVVPACVVAAVVAAVAPGLWWLQLGVAVIVAVGAQWLLRPRLFPVQR